jgi:hypothetical protein
MEEEKKKRGGARKGAGRKRLNFPELPRVTRDIATLVLASKPSEDKTKGYQGEIESWRQLLSSPDARLRFAALRYLTDRRDGRPAIKEVPQEHKGPAKALAFGNLPMPAPDNDPGRTGRPN